MGEDPEPPDAPRRPILALGDSFLAALQVDDGETMTTRLERGLSGALGHRPRVVNAGVSGWGPSQYLLEARAELARRPYELVLVFLYLGNDVLEVRTERFPPKKPRGRHRFGWPDRFDRRAVVKSFVYPVNDFLETRSHAFVLLRRATTNTRTRLGIGYVGFPPADLRSEAGSPRWRVTGEICEDLAALAREHGAPTLFVLLPGPYHVDREHGHRLARAMGLGEDEVDLDQSRRLLVDELRRRGLRFVDTTPALAREHERGKRVHGEIDSHLSAHGHAVVAHEIRREVLALLRSGPP